MITDALIYRENGTPSTARVVFAAIPPLGSKIVIGGDAFEYGKDFLQSDSLSGVAFNFAAAVDADPDETEFHTRTNPVGLVGCVRYRNEVVLVASVPGTAGNLITLSYDGPEGLVILSGSHLSGGEDPVNVGGGAPDPRVATMAALVLEQEASVKFVNSGGEVLLAIWDNEQQGYVPLVCNDGVLGVGEVLL